MDRGVARRDRHHRMTMRPVARILLLLLQEAYTLKELVLH